MTALFVLEIIGTIAFAVSGALVAIKAKLDLFGVVLLGCITAVGGGILRDIIIGAVPPAIFARFHIVLIAVVVSVVAFIVSYLNRHKFTAFRKKIEHINNLFDAVGLAAFSVMGTEIAFTSGLGDRIFLSITLGLLTGVGGGVIRDILVNDTPYILRKHVYALISIFGSALYYILRYNTGDATVSMIAPMLSIVILRILAAKYRWSLPKVHIDEEEK
ncbi:MAG: trimeric intracellular cation channel family protein [Ruminococcaceae bacterium]|nr:trimeric intracellular cation channel family protein [Oscillospiraceae bacterium]